MNLSPEHQRILLECIHQTVPNAQVFIYGSRARGKSKPHSDIDVLVQGASSLSPLELSAIKEALSISNLPFFVDIQDYSQLDPEFLASILKDVTLLTKKRAPSTP